MQAVAAPAPQLAQPEVLTFSTCEIEEVVADLVSFVQGKLNC